MPERNQSQTETKKPRHLADRELRSTEKSATDFASLIRAALANRCYAPNVARQDSVCKMSVFSKGGATLKMRGSFAKQWTR